QPERRKAPMNLKRTNPIRSSVCAIALGAMLVASVGCDAEVVGADYPAGYYGDYPPDAYIATTEPVYYEGNAAYWYGGFWYYRGPGGRWNHYGSEPAGLHARRIQAAPGRRAYESRGRGRAVFHGGGGRGGGHR